MRIAHLIVDVLMWGIVGAGALGWIMFAASLGDRPSARQLLARDAEQVWLHPEDQEEPPQ